ncbi:hypothetical protein V2I01_36790 [Micromonospora sp. BRA006-A]|nr:hypothetical protein [Micromonospora sp. BRA006-A]
MELALSHHPAGPGRPAGQLVLRYRLGGVDTVRHTVDGRHGTVELPAPPGAWRRHTFDLLADVRRLWPDIVAGDNSLRGLRLGVTVAGGGRGAYLVDRLVFDRARRAGQAGEELRAEVLRATTARTPASPTTGRTRCRWCGTSTGSAATARCRASRPRRTGTTTSTPPSGWWSSCTRTAGWCAGTTRWTPNAANHWPACWSPATRSA